MQIKKPAQLALYIDSTLLKAGAIKKEIKALCKEAARYGFKSVCVNPCWVEYCAGSLKNSPVKVCTVIGFPLGASTIRTKVFEAREAVKNGADELDAVINIGCCACHTTPGHKQVQNRRDTPSLESAV